MNPRIGIRREDDTRGERRTPLIPYHARLLRHEGVDVTVQSSPLRAYTDAEYQNASAAVHENLEECHVVFGIHPPALNEIDGTRAYACMARVLRRPQALAPLMQRLLAEGGTLLDLASLCDEHGRSLVGFARHAGLAGFVDALWALGRRLKIEGSVTPLLALTQARDYEGLDAIRLAMAQVGRRISEQGWPSGVAPLVIGFTGTGPLAAATQELLDVLPVREIAAEELAHIEFDAQLSPNRIYKVVFETHHLVQRDDGSGVVESELWRYPDRFVPQLQRFLPFLDVLVHAAPWDSTLPPLLTRDALRVAWSAPRRPKLIVVSDLTRDEGGSFSPLFPLTTPEHATYIYDPVSGGVDESWSGKGPLVLALEHPSNELARDASAEFGQRLLPFASAITWGVLGRRLDLEKLPATVRTAVVLHRGELQPAFASLSAFL